MPTTDRSNTELIRRRRCQVMADGFFPRGTPKDASTELYRKFGDYRYFVDGKLSGIYPAQRPAEITIYLTCGTTVPITLEAEKQYRVGNTETNFFMNVLFATGGGPRPVGIAPGASASQYPGSTAITDIQCIDIISLTCGDTPSITPGNAYVFYNGTLAKQTRINVTSDGDPELITLLPGQYSDVITNVQSVGSVSCIDVLSIQCRDSPPSVTPGDDYVLKNVGAQELSVTYTDGSGELTSNITPSQTLLVQDLQSISVITCVL